MINKLMNTLIPAVVFTICCCLLLAGQAQARSCTVNPPTSGTWEITSDCVCGDFGQNDITLNDNVNVLVKNGAVLTIRDNFDFKMDLKNANLKVENGSGVLIENGGKLQQK